KCNRVLPRLLCQFIHEALDGEHVVVGPDAPPEPGRHSGWLALHELNLKVRDVVGHIDGAVHPIDVDSLLERGRQPACDDGRAGDAMFPRGDLAAGHRCREAVVIRRTVYVVLYVLLAGPYYLHRSFDLLRYPDRTLDIVH